MLVITSSMSLSLMTGVSRNFIASERSSTTGGDVRDRVVGAGGHVARSGAACLAYLQEMAARHPIIGIGQGKGYLLGLEIVDPVTGQPSTEMMGRVALRCMEKGVSVSPSGTG